MSVLDRQDAIEERRAQDRAFKFGDEPQTLACDHCGRKGNAHCFGRFSFRGEAPEFLCVDCIMNRASMVVSHCKEKQILIRYEPPDDS